MKLWIDDVRPAPEGQGYTVCKSVKIAKQIIEYNETIVHRYSVYLFEKSNLSSWQRQALEATIRDNTIDLIDIDHDAGDFASDGGDYIKLLDWLEETGRNYPIRIHSANPVGVQNMRRIIERNGWKEIR